MWQNELDNAKNCLAAGDVSGALSAYESCARELGGENLKKVDIALAIRVCNYYLACETGEIAQVDRTGNELSSEIYGCRQAALALDKHDMVFVDKMVQLSDGAFDGMSTKEILMADNGGRMIGALDGESLLYLGALVRNGAKIPLKFLQIGDGKSANNLRGRLANNMRDYMLIALTVYLEDAGMSEDFRRKFYMQLVELEFCVQNLDNPNYILYGLNGKNLSTKKKMQEIYKYLHIMNPRLLLYLLAIIPVIIILMIIK